MILEHLLTVVAFLTITYIIKYYWSRRKLYAIANQFPGPLSVPLIGNAYIFRGHHKEIAMKIVNHVKSYDEPTRFWLGPHLVLVFGQTEYVEKIMSSTKLSHKHDIYEFIKPYLGNGLISGSGLKWKTARRIIQPHINAKFVSESADIFQKHLERFIIEMEKHVGKPTFNVQPMVHKYVVDIVGETLLGTKVNAQGGENLDLIQEVIEGYIAVFERMTKPWLYPEFLYVWSGKKAQQIKQTKVMYKFFSKVKNEATEKFLKGEVTHSNDFCSSVYGIVDGFLKNKETLDEDDFVFNLATLYSAAEDTISLISSTALLIFGMYSEYQDKAVQEIKNVIGEKPRHLTYDEINSLPLLDMCLKEIFRLFPIAPFILRKTVEEFQLGNWTIPPDCGILVAIFNLHLDPQHWERPMEFYPEHFLPEVTRKRHTFAYIPFSAGPRGCIGKLYAYTSIKIFLVNVLQRYKIEADGNYTTVYNDLRADISVRPKHGYPIRLKHRLWK